MSRQNLLFFRETRRGRDDRDLVQASLQGDRLAFEKIVERYRDKVYWTANNLVLDSEDARDIAQQTFIKVWRSLKDYDMERPFAGWICRIAANTAIDFLRSRKESDPIPEEIPAEHSSIDQDLDMRRIFLRIAPLLSQRQRVVLVLREVQGMEIAEIAEILQCTESTVRNLLSQAKDSFRRKTRELFPGSGL